MAYLPLLLALLPTLALAAGVATPPVELAEKMPETTIWLFGLTLGAMVACVWLIAKMFSRGIEKSIQHSKEITQAHIDEAARTNDAQWQEIRNLTSAAHKADTRLTVLETEHKHYCGGRRMYDPPVRTHYEVPQD